jgi:hypothetical protein
MHILIGIYETNKLWKHELKFCGSNLLGTYEIRLIKFNSGIDYPSAAYLMCLDYISQEN